MKSNSIQGNSNAFKMISRDKYLYMLLIPGIIFFILFKYLPMFGIVIAFKDYDIFKGVLASNWVGLKNFSDMFNYLDFWKVLRNTLLISIYKIIFGFPAPIILSILLNEIVNKGFKRSIQTILYLPHFTSWAVIAGIMLSVLSTNYGPLGTLFKMLGQQPINIVATAGFFRPMLVASDIWKEVGWGTIIYLAALTQIDVSLYEAAIVDGANRWKQMWHITLPSITGVIVLMLILRIGNLMNAGFDQILALQNPNVMDVGDIIDTFTYRFGIQSFRYSFASAVGLFNSVVAMILIVGADRVSKTIGEEGLL